LPITGLTSISLALPTVAQTSWREPDLDLIKQVEQDNWSGGCQDSEYRIKGAVEVLAFSIC
jgi:hypothetical protein